MTARLAAACIIGSQLALLALLVDTRGATATAYSFVGHPLLALGLALGLLALVRPPRV